MFGDGLNDVFEPKFVNKSGYVVKSFKIFNRWGDIIFTSKGYQTPFDGKYKGSDLPVGTYYYVFGCPSEKAITGSVLIMK